jgi:hypothetical protein
MSILANRAAKPKAKRQRVFSITFTIEGDSYAVSRLPAHPEVARSVFRFRKLTGDQAVYDVRFSPEGWAACDCKGHEHHGHCKHVDTIKAAAGIFNLEPVAPRSMTAEQLAKLSADFA